MHLVKNLGRNEITSASYISKRYFKPGGLYQILIYQVNLEKMLSIIMILVGLKVRDFTIYFLTQADCILVHTGKMIQKL